ncbi:hypothetical protein ONS96_013992 [Cadophora gregata f. sp. sojae]|nr:hypothetical protein ONS96_013992 [Cadophora gregata f. sp. sojae]
MARDNNQVLDLLPQTLSLVEIFTKPPHTKSPLRDLFLDISLKYLDLATTDISLFAPKFHQQLLKYAVEQYRLSQTPNGVYTTPISTEIDKKRYHEKAV